jgi:hypothetical protein
MAFLVCYSRSPSDDHARDRAIYLDHRFYELIFKHCRSERGPYTVLREIASLRYKSPMLIVIRDRLTLLDQELEKLEASGLSHPQIAGFRQVCSRAKLDGCALTISGDMYPELFRLGKYPDADKKALFLLFLVSNLMAAYAPGVLWLPSLPGYGASPWLLPLSPVLLVMFLLGSENPVACCAVLVAFLLLIATLSAQLYRLRPAWVILPGVLFLLSLVQGLLLAEIVRGIDAIGHS